MFKIGLREKVNDPSVGITSGLGGAGRSFRRAADPPGAKPRDGAGGQGETLSRLGANAPRRSD